MDSVVHVATYHITSYLKMGKWRKAITNPDLLKIAYITKISPDYMGQVTKLQLSCYLVLLSIDSKTR